MIFSTFSHLSGTPSTPPSRSLPPDLGSTARNFLGLQGIREILHHGLLQRWGKNLGSWRVLTVQFRWFRWTELAPLSFYVGVDLCPRSFQFLLRGKGWKGACLRYLSTHLTSSYNISRFLGRNCMWGTVCRLLGCRIWKWKAKNTTTQVLIRMCMSSN